MHKRPNVTESVRSMLDPVGFRRIVVAVSGGPDSVAMLASLHELFPDRIFILHVNHCLRGAAGEADELFVRDLAASLGVPYRCTRAETLAVAIGRNIEAVARRLRYAALFDAARDVSAEVIVTGHTADDQAETVMHRMIRGAGLSGLAGILPYYRRNNITVVRPLLHVRRRDLLTYLDSKCLSFRTDETNRDIRFTRNRIRWEVMPMLESLNPRVVKHHGRIAEMALQFRSREFAWAKQCLRDCELPRAGQLCVLNREKLAQLSEERRMQLWRSLWRRENWERRDMGFRQWKQLARIEVSTVTAMDLPGGIRIRKLDRIFRVGPDA